MEKDIIFAVSSYNQKYYFGESTKTLPIDIKSRLKEIGIYIVNKVNGRISIGFYNDGNLFIEHSFNEDDFFCDEIGARLEIDKLQKEEKELLESLRMWYKVFVLKLNEMEIDR